METESLIKKKPLEDVMRLKKRLRSEFLKKGMNYKDVSRLTGISYLRVRRIMSHQELKLSDLILFLKLLNVEIIDLFPSETLNLELHFSSNRKTFGLKIRRLDVRLNGSDREKCHKKFKFQLTLLYLSILVFARPSNCSFEHGFGASSDCYRVSHFEAMKTEYS